MPYYIIVAEDLEIFKRAVKFWDGIFAQFKRDLIYKMNDLLYVIDVNYISDWWRLVYILFIVYD